MSPHDSGKDPAPAVKGMDNILAVTTTAVSKMQQEIATLRGRVEELEVENENLAAWTDATLAAYCDMDDAEDAALEEVARLRGNWAALRALVKTMIKDLRGIEDAHGYKDALQTVLKTMTGIARRVREEEE